MHLSRCGGSLSKRTFGSISYDNFHIPVLPEKTLDVWKTGAAKHNNSDPLVYVDGTVGYGGHSEMLLRALPNAKVMCIDRDSQALEMTQKRLSLFKDRVHLIHGSYADIQHHLVQAGLPQKVSGILLDLGVNSNQLQEQSRGFSIYQDGPLDMRFDQNDTSLTTAQQIVNKASEADLTEIFWNYGGESRAKTAAKAIVQHRNRGNNEFTTTKELRECLYLALRGGKETSHIHPATRCFQALRIQVNQELDHLQKALTECVNHLDIHGVLAVISFHSLEDRPVKHAMKNYSTMYRNEYQLLTRKPIKADDEELRRNPRSRSARLRGIMRISSPIPANQ